MGSQDPSLGTVLVRQGQRHHHHPQEVRLDDDDDDDDDDGGNIVVELSAKFEEDPGWVGRRSLFAENNDPRWRRGLDHPGIS